MDRDFERVYTVEDWWDGPRLGVSDVHGAPHWYRSILDETADEWDPDRFELSPIPPAMMPQVLEAWDIWIRWLTAFHSGDLADEDSAEPHGALARDKARCTELRRQLEGVSVTDPGNVVVMRGQLRPVDGTPSGHLIGVPAELEVRWRPAEVSTN